MPIGGAARHESPAIHSANAQRGLLHTGNYNDALGSLDQGLGNTFVWRVHRFPKDDRRVPQALVRDNLVGERESDADS